MQQNVGIFVAFILGVGTMFTLSNVAPFHANEEGAPARGSSDTAPGGVHVHSDFLVLLAGEELDLSAERYMSAAERTHHEHIHLHDGNDEVIHRHEHDITLADFFSSLGFTLTNECFTTDVGRQYCSDGTQQLLLFVNGEREHAPSSYVNQEGDRLLLYYGDPESDQLQRALERVTNTACIFSGTCPERGTAPPESCGLTCEL